jgi:hypothetical protein
MPKSKSLVTGLSTLVRFLLAVYRKVTVLELVGGCVHSKRNGLALDRSEVGRFKMAYLKTDYF